MILLWDGRLTSPHPIFIDSSLSLRTFGSDLTPKETFKKTEEVDAKVNVQDGAEVDSAEAEAGDLPAGESTTATAVTASVSIEEEEALNDA